MLLKDRIALARSKHPKLRPVDIARYCGVSTASVADWENGETKSLKARTARLAGQLFRCDAAWIGEGVGEPGWRFNPDQDDAPPTRLVAQDLSQPPYHDPPLLGWEEIVRGPRPLQDAFVLAVPDDALAPRTPRGTRLVFSRDAPPKPGVGVIVQDGTGSIYLRRYVQGRGTSWSAQASDANYASLESADDQLVILAVAVGRQDGTV